MKTLIILIKGDIHDDQDQRFSYPINIKLLRGCLYKITKGLAWLTGLT